MYYLRINDYDCNMNGIGDSLDIALGTSLDTNSNKIPDECEAVPTAIPGDGLTSYKLYQNVPNPFNPTTTIHYEVPAGLAAVRLQIFDVSGRLVRTLVDGYVGPGRKSASWNGLDTSGRPVASGLYFYRLEAGGFSETRKMLFLK